MPRLQPVDVESATGETRERLAAVQEELGMVPDRVRAMAHFPAVLEASVGVTRALAAGRRAASLREQIAFGRMRGPIEEAIRDSRPSISPDRVVEAALQCSRRGVTQPGRIDGQDVARLCRAGYGSGEITEFVDQVALSLFINDVSQRAGTAVDLPLVPELSPPPA